MKIAFDHQVFTRQVYGGVSRYYTILADELLTSQQDIKVFAGFYRNNYIGDLPAGVVKGKRLSKYPLKSGRFFQWVNHFNSQIQMKSWQPDIIHETYYSALPTLKASAVRVTSVYDMIHELFSDYFSASDATTQEKKSTFSRVDHIISISHSTKRDLIDLFGIDDQKITVVHLGVDLSAFKNVRLASSTEHKPFLLYVGSRKGYKNFNGFIRAFASSVRLINELDIRAFGGGEFNSEEKKLITQLGFKPDQVQQVSGDDAVLAMLYQQAIAFVYPSLYEGFGLPPLEAMAANCPVISSNSSSMPEVVRNAGVYFDPQNCEEIRQTIEEVVFSDELKKQLIKLGQDNIKHFSWEKCAQETLNVYEGLAKS